MGVGSIYYTAPVSANTSTQSLSGTLFKQDIQISPGYILCWILTFIWKAVTQISTVKIKIGECSPVPGGALVGILGRIGAFLTDLNL